MRNTNTRADKKGNQYIDIEMENREKVRVTLIGDSWSSSAGIRVQIRQEDGHLRQGPDIPVEVVGEVVGAVVELVRRTPASRAQE